MSFDTLLTVLFVVVFIVLPLVSRVLRERNRPPTSRQGTARPPAPGGAPAGQASPGGDGDLPDWVAEAQRRVGEARERANTEASTQRKEDRSLVPEDPFGTLAPADRRGRMVPEDPFRGQGPARAQERTLVAGDPFEKGLVGAEEAQRAGPGLGREGASSPPARGPRSETAVGAERRTRAEAGEARPARDLEAELQSRPGTGALPGGSGSLTHARRRARRHGARLGDVGQLRFDREAIVSGLIWHEILDEPAWKRRRGRVPSRPRSR